MAKRGYPTVQEPELPAEEITRDIRIRVEIASTPSIDIKDPAQIWQRAEWYFQMCEKYSMRPTIEGLCLSFHITRKTLWNWTQENTKRGEVARQLKQIIISLLESWSVEGHLSPPIAIFWMKNIANFRDQVEITAVNGNVPIAEKTPEEIARIIETDIPVDDPEEQGKP